MEEVFPVLASVGFGALAAWVSGELAISPVYVAIDAAQVAIAAILTAMLVTAWRRRQLRTR